MATITDTTTDANGNVIVDVSSSADDSITLATAGTYSDKNIIFNLAIETGAAQTAQQAAENASKSAAAAAASETAAKASEEAAKASETAAKASETAAQASQTAAAESASAAESSATSAQTAQSSAETAQAKAEDAQQGAENARNRAEIAAIKQPYPNTKTGTWWVWDAEKAAYVDSGAAYVNSGAPITDQPQVVEVSGAELALTLANNTETRCTDPVTALTIEGFAAGTEGRAEQWGIIFTASAGGITVTVPDTLIWAIAEPIFTAGATYWLSVVPLTGKYLAVWTEVVADEQATA